MPYRTLSLSVWNLPKLRGLPYGTRSLYVYFLVNRHSQLSGVYALPKDYIVTDANLEIARIETALKKLIEVGLVDYDEDNEVIWVKDMLELQGFHGHLSHQIVVGVAKQLRDLTNSPLVRRALAAGEARGAFADEDVRTVYDTLSIPYPYPIDTVSIPSKAKANALASTSVRPTDSKLALIEEGGVGGETSPAPDTRPQPLPKPRSKALRDQPGELSEKLRTTLLAMQVEAFHPLATPHKLNEKFWNTELDKVEDHGLTIYACLQDVDRYYVKRPNEWPRTENSARSRMSNAIDTAITKLLREHRRNGYAKRATG